MRGKLRLLRKLIYLFKKIVDGTSYVANKTLEFATTAAKTTVSAKSSAYGYVSSLFA